MYADPTEQREYQKLWARRQRKDPDSQYNKWRRTYCSSLKRFVYRVKRRIGCQRCGFSDPRALEFHHCNPDEKKFTISQATKDACSMKRLKEEIRKCEVLCSNCHRIEHWTDYGT